MPEISPPRKSAETFDFSTGTDEALVFLAKKGNSKAMETLVSRYRDFVKACSKSYFLMGADRDDVIQEGMIGLYKAIVNFDAEKEIDFKGFARLCIKRHIISAVKMSTRQKHLPLNSYVSLSVENGESDGEMAGLSAEAIGHNPEQIVLEKEAVADTREKIEAVLSSFEAEVLMLHLNGLSYTDIAAYMDREPKSVDNALQRIKHKIEKLL